MFPQENVFLGLILSEKFMKNLMVKTVCLLLITTFTIAGCTKQQYRARSKHYPHDKPSKQ
jgi:hypothetical protein